MNIQLAIVCDFAADYQGKLCIQGAFDTLCAQTFPVVHPQCSIAVRAVFQAEDAGMHEFVIRCVDPDGKVLIEQFRIMDGKGVGDEEFEEVGVAEVGAGGLLEPEHLRVGAGTFREERDELHGARVRNRARSSSRPRGST